ncbi:MAG TPA: ATP-binding protein, partial [Candidatus Eisenbacteria bacterium]
MSGSPGVEVVRLEIPSRLELLSIIDKVVDGVADQMGFEDDDKDAVAISVIEAGTNAIQHGHGHESERLVEIVFRLE